MKWMNFNLLQITSVPEAFRVSFVIYLFTSFISSISLWRSWLNYINFLTCSTCSVQRSGPGSLWPLWQCGLRPVVQESASGGAASQPSQVLYMERRFFPVLLSNQKRLIKSTSWWCCRKAISVPQWALMTTHSIHILCMCIYRLLIGEQHNRSPKLFLHSLTTELTHPVWRRFNGNECFRFPQGSFHCRVIVIKLHCRCSIISSYLVVCGSVFNTTREYFFNWKFILPCVSSLTDINGIWYIA